MDAILSAISTVGFPIVAVIGCAYFVWVIVNNYRQDCNTNIQEVRAAAERREDRLYQQIDKFEASLDAFNNTLISIDSRLEMLEKKLD